MGNVLGRQQVARRARTRRRQVRIAQSATQVVSDRAAASAGATEVDRGPQRAPVVGGVFSHIESGTDTFAVEPRGSRASLGDLVSWIEREAAPDARGPGSSRARDPRRGRPVRAGRREHPLPVKAQQSAESSTTTRVSSALAGIAAAPRAALQAVAALLRRRPALTPVIVIVVIAAVAGPAVPVVASYLDHRAATETLSLLQEPAFERMLYDQLVPVSAGQSASDNAVTRELTYTPYRVRSGDTISEIAGRFDVTVDTVVSFNDIRRAHQLQVGEVLSIPPVSGLRYTVRRGDNLSSIATRHGVEFDALLDWNELTSEVIRPGQELFLPSARMSENDLNRVLGRLFVMPAIGRLTSRYGYRNDPFTGIRKFHNGVDVANQLGTAVMASMYGRVAQIGYNGNYGRYIILTHPDGFQTLYAHLSEASVSQGQTVSQGQKIGEMGSTGYSTGSHLHFSIFKDGAHVDPQAYLE